jgi:hypothetical protein
MGRSMGRCCENSTKNGFDEWAFDQSIIQLIDVRSKKRSINGGSTNGGSINRRSTNRGSINRGSTNGGSTNRGCTIVWPFDILCGMFSPFIGMLYQENLTSLLRNIVVAPFSLPTYILFLPNFGDLWKYALVDVTFWTLISTLVNWGKPCSISS